MPGRTQVGVVEDAIDERAAHGDDVVEISVEKVAAFEGEAFEAPPAQIGGSEILIAIPLGTVVEDDPPAGINGRNGEYR